jgi:hypothetical protein
LEFLELDGTPTALTASVSLPGRGHVTRAVNDLIKNMPANFRGILRISSSRAVSVVGLRERQNDRGDYLLSTIDIENEAAAAPKSAVFPLLVEGGGYETKLIIFSGAPGGGGSGDIILFDSIP